MLPANYALVGDAALLLGGALACFAGYRQFKIVLVLSGFFAGALAASATMSSTNTTGLVAAALVGGLAGAVVLFFAYFIGIALAGAGLGALVAHVGWSWFGGGDPPAALLIVLAICGAIGAMVLQRYVIVVATAFGGAWAVLAGGMALAADRAATHGAPTGDVWIPYPAGGPAERWMPIAWIALGLAGTAVQLGTSSGRKRKGS